MPMRLAAIPPPAMNNDRQHGARDEDEDELRKVPAQRNAVSQPSWLSVGIG